MAYDSRPGHGASPEHYLRLKLDFPIQHTLSSEQALRTLMRIPSMSTTTPYSFVNIDKPVEGETHVVYILPNMKDYPSDGIRYLEQEQRFMLSGGSGVELEILETKSGFVPGGIDQYAWRIRHRYRLSKGGHGNIVLIHYRRGQPTPIPPQYLHVPVRTYPLRESTEPAIYVLGEKAGQKVYPQNQAALAVASRNDSMAQSDRRHKDSRSAREPAQPIVDDDNDEDYITNRALALSRFKRNHDYLAEIFNTVAINQLVPPPSPYADTNVGELEEKLAKLEAEVQELKGQ